MNQLATVQPASAAGIAPAIGRRALGASFAVALALTACGGGGGSSAPAAAPPATGSDGPPVNSQSVPSAPGASSVQFSGYTWSVRNDTGGPGPNTFSANNVWVDSSGFLHLKIAHSGNAWSTAEVYTNQSLGFGTYQFQIQGHPESMDQNVVLGLFPYTTPAIGPDGTNEIDIEFATWGGQQTQHGNWTVWPAVVGPTNTSTLFNASANSDLSTHRFNWTSESIAFQALTGLTDGNSGQYASWTFAPATYTTQIPQNALPLHINLWLFNGNAPTNSAEVEMVITDFRYLAPQN